MRRSARAAAIAGGVLLALGAIGRAGAQGRARFEGAFFSFAVPDGFSAKPTNDISADSAVAVTRGGGGSSLSATVLAGSRRQPEGELESTAADWHNARVKNRAAWGMKPSGGPPRELVRIGERRWWRWRDRIGSVLGAQEQSMTCGGINGHLGCVVVSAPAKEREAADDLAAELLTSLKIRR